MDGLDSVQSVLSSKYSVLGISVSVAVIAIILILAVLFYFYYWKASFTTHPVVLNPNSTYVLKN